VFEGKVRYTAFLIPGLVMMSVLQNAFANSSSSLIQSKVTGNLVFVLLTPLSPAGIFAAYVVGGQAAIRLAVDPRAPALSWRTQSACTAAPPGTHAVNRSRCVSAPSVDSHMPSTPVARGPSPAARAAPLAGWLTPPPPPSPRS
jgi:hypothetical protein